MPGPNSVILANVAFRAGYVYRLGRARCTLSKRDLRVLESLLRIYEAVPKESNATWLLQCRRQIRHILSACPAEALTLVAISTSDRALCKLALWLRGKCGGRVGAIELYRLAKQNDNEIRARVVRTLRGMGAWNQFRALLEERGIDPVFLRTFSPGRIEFDERLARYISHIAPIPSVAARQTMIVGKSKVDGKRAKPVWLIRLVLDRIGLLVSSRESHDRQPENWT